MRVGSLFAGIGGFDLGFKQAGHETVWQVELDEKCRTVLERHFPKAERFADIRECGATNLAPVDVVCGGFPCQDLSVAGQRAGLAGERSGLFYEMTRIVDELKPAWLIWENVPGLLSSHRGADFARVLVELERVGYLGAWTTLDARYFGVAQRRRRIFGVFTRLYSGAERAAEVLALSARVRGNPPPRSEAGESVAGTLGGGAQGRGRRDNPDSSGAFVANTVRPGDGTGDFRGDGCDNLHAFNIVGGAQEGPNHAYPAERTGTIQHKGNAATGNEAGAVIVTPALQAGSPIYERGDGSLFCVPREWPQEVAPTLDADYASKWGQNNQHINGGAGLFVPDIAWALQERDSKGADSDTKDGHLLPSAHGVRRLTPTECERLQGFPDGWTEGHADSHRYRMLGNAVAVPCARWIGMRLGLAPAEKEAPRD